LSRYYHFSVAIEYNLRKSFENWKGNPKFSSEQTREGARLKSAAFLKGIKGDAEAVQATYGNKVNFSHPKGDQSSKSSSPPQ